MTTPPDENLERALRALRIEYLAESPDRVSELWRALARVQNGDRDGLEALHLRAHRLAGSGGGYGVPDVSAAARDADQYVRRLSESSSLPASADIDRLGELVQGIADAFTKARAPE